MATSNSCFSLTQKIHSLTKLQIIASTVDQLYYSNCTAQSKKITDHSRECFDSGEASGQGSLLMMMAMFFFDPNDDDDYERLSSLPMSLLDYVYNVSYLSHYTSKILRSLKAPTVHEAAPSSPVFHLKL
jgi:hypothetical protein